MSEETELDELWSARAGDRPSRADRTDETERIARAAAGDRHAAAGLVDRHRQACWQMAVVASLDVDAAVDAVEVAWARAIVSRGGALKWPLRRRLLHEARRAAVDLQHSLLAELDLTAGPERGPFGAEGDISLAVPTFTLLPEAQRSAWWMVQVEKVPTREVPPLLDLPALSGMTLTLDAGDAMRSRMLEAQHRSVAGDCRRAVPRFATYLDGELPDADVGVLHRHLDACAGCVQRLDGVDDPMAVLVDRIALAPAELDARLLDLLLPED